MRVLQESPEKENKRQKEGRKMKISKKRIKILEKIALVIRWVLWTIAVILLVYGIIKSIIEIFIK